MCVVAWKKQVHGNQLIDCLGFFLWLLFFRASLVRAGGALLAQSMPSPLFKYPNPCPAVVVDDGNGGLAPPATHRHYVRSPRCSLKEPSSTHINHPIHSLSPLVIIGRRQPQHTGRPPLVSFCFPFLPLVLRVRLSPPVLSFCDNGVDWTRVSH